LHLARHTQLLPRSRLIALGYAGLCALALATALGTFERSALIGLVVMGAYMLALSRHKLMFGLFLAAISAVLLYTMSAGWEQRIATLSDPTQETSALTRLLVWKWTFNYSLTHPFGGGFMSYLVDRLDYPGGQVVFGRAFHSIYFEVLGEQGWVGLALFLGVAGSTFIGLRRLVKQVRGVAHLAWAADMSHALQTSLAVFLTAGAFVGIGFQPTFWYFIAMSVSLREYVRRVQRQQQPVAGWRLRAAPVPAPVAAPPPWRAKGHAGGARARAGSV
jgi:probable O-glycosylation ligase (exosortase A-associated)